MRSDRHGRGVRGPLAWPPVPAMQSRSAQFDDVVLDAVETLERRLRRQLADIEFAVEDVPSTDPAPWEAQLALGRSFPAERGRPARVVLYRRPIESRAVTETELGDLVEDVLAEQVAHVIGIHPDDLED
ncbi:metallopeptidase family protein [Flexivirga sp. ID2601S]|uniref:Metallopeptidase family protein n=1 Tax=Flexivirga aerilata TaxID=1656889 RepID=A0A849AK46_9MICO|nr:metallopeptidase family protein [Flexivirga aerilata]NNG40207.1 metallopeptidase family protein [Flexivirga aerilata]